MPDVANKYIGEGILLSRGDHMSRGHVVTPSHGANENIVDNEKHIQF